MTPHQKPYTGTVLDKPIAGHEYEINDQNFKGKVQLGSRKVVEDIASYYPSNELRKAVEYARILKKPLLLRGEPGCGKTRLAQALAYELYAGEKDEQGKLINYRDYYFEWFVKSTTRAVDGLYTFDHLAKLRDVQLLKMDKSSMTDAERKDLEKLKQKTKESYRFFGSLGKAFLQSKPNRPSILLIDEIDKADIDFPNDLLLELDQKRFFIEETGEEIIAENSPIIIITSNDERELPNAFLRRCVFHYVEFPDDETLLKIARGKALKIEKALKEMGFNRESKTALALKNQGVLHEKDNFTDDFIKKIIADFIRIRSKVESNPSSQKPPSTSELLDWMEVIHYQLLSRGLVLKNGELPKGETLFGEVLLKNLDDQKGGGMSIKTSII
jgi:MoxR-like ATPase